MATDNCDCVEMYMSLNWSVNCMAQGMTGRGTFAGRSVRPNSMTCSGQP